MRGIFGRGTRYRSPQNIINEIEYLYHEHKVRELLIGDSTFNTDRNWVRDICEGILSMDRKIIWRASIRAGLIDKKTAVLMKKAGCQAVVLGVESADEDMLESMNKGQKLADIQKGIDILNEAGLDSHHHYIIGPLILQEKIVWHQPLSFLQHLFPVLNFLKKLKRKGLK